MIYNNQTRCTLKSDIHKSKYDIFELCIYNNQIRCYLKSDIHKSKFNYTLTDNNTASFFNTFFNTYTLH